MTAHDLAIVEIAGGHRPPLQKTVLGVGGLDQILKTVKGVPGGSGGE